MLDHLVTFKPPVEPRRGKAVRPDNMSPADLVDAKVNTAAWLADLGAAETSAMVAQAETEAARAAFVGLVTAAPPQDTHAHLEQIKTPAAVQHLVGMLSAYDWEFVERAKEIRGYVVSRLLAESTDNNASVRLKALALLGKVTEIGLFTDKIEVKKEPLSDDEVDQKIKDKLNRFMNVTDAETIELTEVSANKQADDTADGPQ